MKGPDCPHPGCGMTGCGVPIAVAEGRYYQPKDDSTPRLWCPVCGNSWHGTDAEVWTANRSEAQHQRELAAESKKSTEDAKERALREKLERAMRGEW